jgi:hypothetical protein
MGSLIWSSETKNKGFGAGKAVLLLQEDGNLAMIGMYLNVIYSLPSGDLIQIP